MGFQEARTLHRHMKRHKEHRCEHCDQVFPHFKDLVAHRRSAHPKAFVCGDCGKLYRRERAMRDHQQRVHNQEVLPCPRPDCGQVFTSASNLRVHERTAHQGLRPFACRHCEQTFAYRHVLRRHYRLMHKRGSSLSLSPPRLLRDGQASTSAAASASSAPVADHDEVIFRRVGQRSMSPSSQNFPDFKRRRLSLANWQIASDSSATNCAAERAASPAQLGQTSRSIAGASKAFDDQHEHLVGARQSSDSTECSDALAWRRREFLSGACLATSGYHGSKTRLWLGASKRRRGTKSVWRSIACRPHATLDPVDEI